MKTIIVDDERLARQELRSLLKKHNEIEIVADASDPETAISLIEQYQPDLIFLDIQMPGKTGFEILEDLSFVPHIVFVTAYDEFALKAFEVNALDYLLKPVHPERLAETLNKLKERESLDVIQKQTGGNVLTATDNVFVKDGEKCWFVKLKDVSLFESEGNYVRVHFDGHKPLILKSLNSLSEKLNNRLFFRANRKYIINLLWLENIESWENGNLIVTLKGGRRIEISRRQSARFKELMSL